YSYRSGRQVWRSAVVIQQQILTRVQVGNVLIAVVHLQAGRWEALGHLSQLPLLHDRIGGQVFAWRAARSRSEIALPGMPLIDRAVLLGKRIVNRLAHEEAEDEEDDQEACETGDERNDAANVNVLHLVTRVLGIAHRRDGMQASVGGAQRVVSSSGHVQAPEALRCA